LQLFKKKRKRNKKVRIVLKSPGKVANLNLKKKRQIVDLLYKEPHFETLFKIVLTFKIQAIMKIVVLLLFMIFFGKNHKFLSSCCPM
jgi:hypothetical protein